MQAVVSSYVWDWKELRALLATLAPVCVPDDPDDLIGPGLAIDETAQPKGGNATAGVSPQHAGCAGRVINCVTTVFAAYVTARGHSWVDVEHYLPRRWAVDLPALDQPSPAQPAPPRPNPPPSTPPTCGFPARRRHPDHRRSALPHRPRPDQALPRRDTPRQRPRRTPPRRTDHQERPRVRAPLVAAAQTPPGGGTVAPLQPPPHRDHCQRPTNGDPERKSHDVTTPGTRHITLRGSAMTHRKTATVVQGDNSRPRCRAQQRIAVSARAPLMRFVSEHPPCSAQPRTGAHDGTRARALW